MMVLIRLVTYAWPFVIRAGGWSLTFCEGVTQETDGRVPSFAAVMKDLKGRMSESWWSWRTVSK